MIVLCPNCYSEVTIVSHSVQCPTCGESIKAEFKNEVVEVTIQIYLTCHKTTESIDLINDMDYNITLPQGEVKDTKVIYATTEASSGI